EIACKEIKKLSLKKKKPLEIQEVQGLKAALNAINSPKEKIFCIGLSRTCTKSLTMALDILGFNVIHYPDDPLTFKELSSGNYNLSLLNDYDGIADITVSPYFAQLDKIYPNSKFILTIREKESWLRSLKKHWEDRPPFQDKNETPIHMKVRRFLRAAVYGTYKFNRERMSYVYDIHNKNVLDYFKDKPNSLLILDIYGGEGWSKLCKFLNTTQIQGPFPDVKNSLELFEVL
ncbi:MAG: sulfotransferase family protein, partial [Promethearchaeota archaeon]